MYSPKGFDRRRAIQLAELVHQAYLQYEAFSRNEAWSLPSPYTLAAELKYTGAQPDAHGSAAGFEKELRQLARARSRAGEDLPIGFIALSKADAYLVFRGTMTTTEWIRDFNLRLTTFPYRTFGRVHDGFIRTYDLFRASIHDGLGRLGPGRRLFIAGHSLGAALATLAGPDIASRNGGTAATVYTFGSPRVGDRTFANEYNRLFRERSFRVANSSDIVVAMPFPVPFLGFLGGYFTHVETAVDFTVQEEDVEKNHEIETYLGALRADADNRGLLRSIFPQRA